MKTPVSRKSANKHKKNYLPLQYLLGSAIILFTLVLYLNSLKNGFVDWDDPDYLRDNIAVHKLGWEQLKTIFTSFHSGNYHPFTTLSYSLEYAVSGYGSATLYHFNNLWLHLVNVLLVFWFIKMISNDRLVPAIVAFWFGIHPMHVESVAWISERKDLLYGVFFLAGLISYCYYLREHGNIAGPKKTTTGRKRIYYFLTLLFFLFSLLSKSAAVVLPLVLLLIDFLIKRKFYAKQLIEKIPFFALALLFGYLAILSQDSAIHRGMELDLSPVNRFFTVNYAIFRYVAMLFYPSGLSAYHPYPAISPDNIGAVIYISVLFMIILVGGAIYLLKDSRKWFFGLFFFLVNIALVLQILPVGGAFIAERYTYISYIGLFYILACLLVLAIEKTKSSLPLRIVLIAFFILFSGVCSITTYYRIQIWKDSLSLFDDVVNKYPENYLAYYLRGSAKQYNDPPGAIADYTKSVALNSNNPKALNNRGNIYSANGRYKEALVDYDEALKFDPTIAEALNNRGAIKAIFGDFNGALADIEKAIAIRPGYSDAYRNRGLVRLQMNDRSSARNDWKKAEKMGDGLAGKLLNKYPE